MQIWFCSKWTQVRTSSGQTKTQVGNNMRLITLTFGQVLKLAWPFGQGFMPICRSVGKRWKNVAPTFGTIWAWKIERKPLCFARALARRRKGARTRICWFIAVSDCAREGYAIWRKKMGLLEDSFPCAPVELLKVYPMILLNKLQTTRNSIVPVTALFILFSLFYNETAFKMWMDDTKTKKNWLKKINHEMSNNTTKSHVPRVHFIVYMKNPLIRTAITARISLYLMVVRSLISLRVILLLVRCCATTSNFSLSMASSRSSLRWRFSSPCPWAMESITYISTVASATRTCPAIVSNAFPLCQEINAFCFLGKILIFP